MNLEPPVRFPKYSNGALKTTYIDILDTWRVGWALIYFYDLI